MTTTNFTIQDALNIQDLQFSRWAIVLNDNAIALLKKEIDRRNDMGYSSPYQVFRGIDMDAFIKNEIMTPSELKLFNQSFNQ